MQLRTSSSECSVPLNTQREISILLVSLFFMLKTHIYSVTFHIQIKIQGGYKYENIYEELEQPHCRG